MKKVIAQPWSTNEKLCLALIVQKGDDNWMSVSRTIREHFDETTRPPDWFSHSQCAAQFEVFLKTYCSTPKRKKRAEKGVPDAADEKPVNVLVEKLKQERVAEVQQGMLRMRVEYLKLKHLVAGIDSGTLSDEKVQEHLHQLEEEIAAEEAEQERFRRGEETTWLVEPPLPSSPLPSDVSSTLKPPPTSPLLTSLLQSPSPSTATVHHRTSPTISLLLQSTPSITSPTRNHESPTLSKLLESPTNTAQSPTKQFSFASTVPGSMMGGVVCKEEVVEMKSEVDSSQLDKPVESDQEEMVVVSAMETISTCKDDLSVKQEEEEEEERDSDEEESSLNLTEDSKTEDDLVQMDANAVKLMLLGEVQDGIITVHPDNYNDNLEEVTVTSTTPLVHGVANNSSMDAVTDLELMADSDALVEDGGEIESLEVVVEHSADSDNKVDAEKEKREATEEAKRAWAEMATVDPDAILKEVLDMEEVVIDNSVDMEGKGSVSGSSADIFEGEGSSIETMHSVGVEVAAVEEMGGDANYPGVGTSIRDNLSEPESAGRVTSSQSDISVTHLRSKQLEGNSSKNIPRTYSERQGASKVEMQKEVPVMTLSNYMEVLPSGTERKELTKKVVQETLSDLAFNSNSIEMGVMLKTGVKQPELKSQRNVSDSTAPSKSNRVVLEESGTKFEGLQRSVIIMNDLLSKSNSDNAKIALTEVEGSGNSGKLSEDSKPNNETVKEAPPTTEIDQPLKKMTRNTLHELKHIEVAYIGLTTPNVEGSTKYGTGNSGITLTTTDLEGSSKKVMRKTLSGSLQTDTTEIELTLPDVEGSPKKLTRKQLSGSKTNICITEISAIDNDSLMKVTHNKLTVSKPSSDNAEESPRKVTRKKLSDSICNSESGEESTIGVEESLRKVTRKMLSDSKRNSDTVEESLSTTEVEKPFRKISRKKLADSTPNSDNAVVTQTAIEDNEPLNTLICSNVADSKRNIDTSGLPPLMTGLEESPRKLMRKGLTDSKPKIDNPEGTPYVSEREEETLQKLTRKKLSNLKHKSDPTELVPPVAEGGESVEEVESLDSKPSISLTTEEEEHSEKKVYKSSNTPKKRKRKSSVTQQSDAEGGEPPKKMTRKKLADSIPNSPASIVSSVDEERDMRTWKKTTLLYYNRIATHKHASLFLRPITNEQVFGYHKMVFRATDLSTIKKNIENGTMRSTVEFQREVLQMFQNAVMFNESNTVVYKMASCMQKECFQHLQLMVQATGEGVPIEGEGDLLSTRRSVTIRPLSPKKATPQQAQKRKRQLSLNTSKEDSRPPSAKKARKSYKLAAEK